MPDSLTHPLRQNMESESQTKPRVQILYPVCAFHSVKNLYPFRKKIGSDMKYLRFIN